MGHEQDEFADFYRPSRDACLRAVTAVVGDRELAEEQVAEAFTRAWTSWGQVRRHAAPRAWVVRTALNLGVSWWRRRRREVPLAVANCPEVAGLIDHPAAFPYVWSTLGWNIHVHHSHLDVHPPIRVHMPFRFDWHQDGGRQNRELETTPRPRLSVKLAYWLSDVTEPGRGNLKVVPRSHTVNWIDGPPRRDIEWPDPEGAIEVTAEPGDAMFFDRRIWHARSRNYSEHTRKAVFFGYTYRWTVIRDDIASMRASDWFGRLTPVQQQLLGDAGHAGGDHAWGHDPATSPLYGWLNERGFLDPANPPLRP